MPPEMAFKPDVEEGIGDKVGEGSKCHVWVSVKS